MEYVYHGSKTKGLKKLKKRSSTHQKEWIYATLSKAIAIIFISNGGSDLNYDLSGSGTKESPITLTERKAGMFDDIFNLSGSLYTLSGKNFQKGKTGWSAEVVSEFEEDIIAEEYIENVLEKLNELSEQGEIKLYRYPNRPDFVPSDNSDLIPKIIDWNERGFKGATEKFLQLYPELSDKLYEQMKTEESSLKR